MKQIGRKVNTSVYRKVTHTDEYIIFIVARLRGRSNAPRGQYMPYRPSVRAIYIVALTVYTITN